MLKTVVPILFSLPLSPPELLPSFENMDDERDKRSSSDPIEEEDEAELMGDTILCWYIPLLFCPKFLYSSERKKLNMTNTFGSQFFEKLMRRPIPPFIWQSRVRK